MFSFNPEHVCSYFATLDPNFEIIGNTPEGLRMTVYITGGEVSGPKLKGKVRPVGADWVTIRPDGVGIVDVRTTLETEDGALIDIRYNGYAEFGKDGFKRFAEGNPPTKFTLHCAPQMRTSHPDYLWVNRVQFINVGEGDLVNSRVSYDVYAI